MVFVSVLKQTQNNSKKNEKDELYIKVNGLIKNNELLKSSIGTLQTLWKEYLTVMGSFQDHI